MVTYKDWELISVPDIKSTLGYQVQKILMDLSPLEEHHIEPGWCSGSGIVFRLQIYTTLSSKILGDLQAIGRWGLTMVNDLHL